MISTNSVKQLRNMSNECGLTCMWYENLINISYLKFRVSNILLDQFKQLQYSDVQDIGFFFKPLSFDRYILNLPTKPYKKY